MKTERNILRAELDYMNEWLSQDHSRTVEDFVTRVVLPDSQIYKIWQETKDFLFLCM